jgi:hypothetical protein
MGCKAQPLKGTQSRAVALRRSDIRFRVMDRIPSQAALRDYLINLAIRIFCKSLAKSMPVFLPKRQVTLCREFRLSVRYCLSSIDKILRLFAMNLQACLACHATIALGLARYNFFTRTALLQALQTTGRREHERHTVLAGPAILPAQSLHDALLAPART